MELNIAVIKGYMSSIPQWLQNRETQAVILTGLCCVGAWVILTWIVQVRKFVKIKKIIIIMWLKILISNNILLLHIIIIITFIFSLCINI